MDVSYFCMEAIALETIQLDVRSAALTEPHLALLFGQVETAERFLVWLTQRCSQEEMEYRGPAGDRNSIATLILHIAGCNLMWVYPILQDRPVPEELQGRFILHEGDGPMPAVVGLPAAELLDRHRESVAHLREYLLTLSDADLDRTVSMGPEVEATIRWGLWHIAEHSMLHQGHIRWLRLWYRDEQKRREVEQG